MLAEFINDPKTPEATPSVRPSPENADYRELARHKGELFDRVRAIVLPGDSTGQEVMDRLAEWRTALEGILSDSYDGCQEPAPCLHCGGVNEKADYALRSLLGGLGPDAGEEQGG